MQTFVKRSDGRRHVAFYHRWIVPLEVWQQVPNLSMQSTSNVQNVQKVQNAQNVEMRLAWQIKPTFPDSLQFWNLAMFDRGIWQCRSGYAVIMPGHQKLLRVETRWSPYPHLSSVEQQHCLRHWTWISSVYSNLSGLIICSSLVISSRLISTWNLGSCRVHKSHPPLLEWKCHLPMG